MIQLAIDGEIEQTLLKVERAVISHGGQFKGDSRTGIFSGKTMLGEVRGEYRVSSGKICIKILRKPTMVPLAMIEKEIRGYFSRH
jgi:hypothetical protein